MATDQPSFYRTPPRPIFRKLFKQGHLFICGICRSQYSSRVEANNCLNFCWFELKSMSAVVIFRDRNCGFRYRCQYCARDFATNEDASQCAQSCIDKRNQIHIHEQLWNDLPLADQRPTPVVLVPKNVFIEMIKKPASPTRNKTKSRPRHKAAHAAFGRSSKYSPVPIPSIESGPTGIQSTEASDVIDTLVHQAASLETELKAAQSPSEDHHHISQYTCHWHPNPLGYRCSVCQSIHELESEAEACFYRHFAADGARLDDSSELDLDS